ncbi:MAG: NAD(P)H-hydrate dehydratase [Burkholderiales bacterium]|nr:NAD(P)H-hydrate dehydratase [Burkholderiales bacterium]
MAETSTYSFLPIFSVDELRMIEERYQKYHLMTQAGDAAFRRAQERLKGKSNPLCVVLCGPGNNGGDGFVAARLLKKEGVEVIVVAPQTGRYVRDAQKAKEDWLNEGGKIHETLPRMDRPPTLIIDAIFGIGLARRVAPPFSDLMNWGNETVQKNPNKTAVLALDIASGLDAKTGVAQQPTLRANETLCFISTHAGCYTRDGADYSGTVRHVPLDFPFDPKIKAQMFVSDVHALKKRCPPPLQRTRQNVHKGTFGTLAIIGGEEGMIGAPILAARAARVTGAGKIAVGFVGQHPFFDSAYPELMLTDAEMILAGDFDACVTGCGLGQSDHAASLIERVMALDQPIVLDADAITLLSKNKTFIAALKKRNAPTILTPHPAEAARLLKTKTEAVQNDRIAAARELAKSTRAHIVLKGSGTLIAYPDKTIIINTTGNNALAFGGSGDLLSGMIGALLAQSVKPEVAAVFAVGLHGAAADAYVKKAPACSMRSEDFLKCCRRVLSKVLN